MDLLKQTVFHVVTSLDRLTFFCVYAEGDGLIISIENEKKYHLVIKKIDIQEGYTSYYFEGVLRISDTETTLCRGEISIQDRKGWLQKIKKTEWRFE